MTLDPSNSPQEANFYKTETCYLSEPLQFEIPSAKEVEKEIIISNITSASIDGNTYYYIIDKENKKYKVSIKTSDNLPFVKVNDKITITYTKEKEIIDIISIK